LAELGDLHELEKILANKNKDSKGPYGRTCMMLAAMSNQTETLGFILKRIANPNLRCQLNLTALDWAMRLNQY
jgi:ankyrin repeat protein